MPFGLWWQLNRFFPAAYCNLKIFVADLDFINAKKTQGAILQADDSPDFQRHMIVLMYTDFDWQSHLVDALLPHVTDPDLRAYLEDSGRVHQEGLRQLQALLKQYKYEG